MNKIAETQNKRVEATFFLIIYRPKCRRNLGSFDMKMFYSRQIYLIFADTGFLGIWNLPANTAAYDELIVDMLVRIRKEDDVLCASCGFQGIDGFSTSVLRRVSTLQAVKSPV